MSRAPLHLPTLAEIEAANARLAGLAIRTPLVRRAIPAPQAPGPRPEVFLKLENLQPIGSFKLRGAGNAMRRLDATRLRGTLGPILLAWNRLAASRSRTHGGAGQDRFDSWVIRFAR